MKMHLNIWTLVVVAAILCGTECIEIEEPQNYGPKVIPSNIPKARHTLGYDKYERQPVESSKKVGKKFYPYGNNWEQFDAPQINYNYELGGK